MTYKILIVDDEMANLRLLERLFRRSYEVVSASSGAEAIQLLAQHEIAVIISDQRMPGMTGIEFLKRAAVMRQHTVRIILTGYTDVNALVEAINSGVVYKYVTKPWVNEDLQQTVSRALEHHETNKSQHSLALQNERLTAQLETTRQSFRRFLIDAPERAERIAGYAAAVARRLNLESDEIAAISQAALFSNAGRQAGSLDVSCQTSETSEYNLRHLEFRGETTARILGDVLNLEAAASIVRHRFENWDGSGSPENLRGEQIPLAARIVSVAAAYDEMTDSEFASPALAHDEAVERLQAAAGTRFDPEVVAAFLELNELARIRRAIADDLIGMRLLAARFFADTNHLSTAALVQKIIAEPMLAMEVLKTFNTAFPAAPTAQLFAAMSGLGEPRLRSLLEQHGLPAENSSLDNWRARSLRRAVAAQMLAAHTNIVSPDDAYTLGLLADVGTVLLANLFPDEMFALEQFEAETAAPENLAVNSLQVSRWMLAACHLPRRLTTALQTDWGAAHSTNPIGLLMSVAGKIADTAEADKVTIIDSLGGDSISILRLSRSDLNRIYERTAALSENRIEVQQEQELEQQIELNLQAELELQEPVAH